MARPKGSIMGKAQLPQQQESDSPKLIWGNLDKEETSELPDNFDPQSQYYVKLWKTKKFDGQLLELKSTIKFQTYDDLSYDQSFGTTVDKRTKQESQPVIQRLGYNYEVLHNPNK